MKVIVTGGAGFIGSHLVDKLIAQGHIVIVVDNFSTGRIENLEHIAENPNLTIVKADIRDVALIDELFIGVNWVFHLAALADIVPSIEIPREYYDVNVTGTLNVVQAAKKANVNRFIYAASSSCYGIPEKYPTAEDSLISPQYPYALTKYMGEEIARHWGLVYNLPTISLRLFNVFGPRSRTSGTYGAVFGVFLAQRLAGVPYTVVGDGTQTRDFTYVEDVANAFVAAAGSNVVNEAMNVGSGGTYSVNALIDFLQGDKVFLPKRPGEPHCTFADTSKIRGILGWEPNFSFQAGVKKVLEHIDYWKEAPVWDKKSIEKATETWFEYLE